MAIFYGAESDFQIKKRKWRRWSMMGLFGVLFLVAILFAVVVRSQGWISIVLLIIFFGGLIQSLLREAGITFFYINRRLGWSNQGLLGERIVRKALEALPDSYSVFQGLRPQHSWDIDFTVVGPNGVFAIEVKSQTGDISFGKGERGNKMLWQTRKETLALHKFLKEGWNITTFIVGILVFARSGADVAESFDRNAYILTIPNLVPTILSHRGSNPQKAQIEKVLEFGIAG